MFRKEQGRNKNPLTPVDILLVLFPVSSVHMHGRANIHTHTHTDFYVCVHFNKIGIL